MHRRSMEEKQAEIRKSISELEEYIDMVGCEDELAYNAAKKNIMFLYTATENQTRHLIRYRDKERRE